MSHRNVHKKVNNAKIPEPSKTFMRFATGWKKVTGLRTTTNFLNFGGMQPEASSGNEVNICHHHDKFPRFYVVPPVFHC